ncbi:MAG: hypothetical protein HRF46_16405 [Acidobacteriota bacterium]|jgi:hypothetical protein
MRLELLLAGVIALGVATAAQAQFTQYSPPGSLAAEERSTKERLEKAMEEARWSLGPLRLEPWVGVGNLTYHDDLEPWREGKQSDVTISAGAGLAAFLPVGSRLLLAGYALPEYSWWRETTRRNRLKGRYGVGAFVDLGRLALEAKGTRSTEPTFLGFDDEVPIDLRRQAASLSAELRLLRRLSIYAEGEDTRWRYRDEDLEGAPLPRLGTLDRDEQRAAGGLRYRFRDRLTLSLGYVRSVTDFAQSQFDRSNSGTAPTVGLTYSGTRLSLGAQVSEYQLEPRAGSSFRPFEGRTGQARAEWKLGPRSGVSVYSQRSLAYAFGGTSYYEVETTGAAVRLPLGWRGSTSLFAESGTHRFLEAERQTRNVSLYGVTANLALRGRTTVSLRWDRRHYGALRGEEERRYNSLIAGLNFGFGSAVTW